VYTLGEFWVSDIHEREREKRSFATTGALVVLVKRDKAGAQT
jgi:hypothetical protein